MGTWIDRLVNLINLASKRLGFLGPLVARFVVGVTFLLTGWGKLHSLDRVTQFFTDLHIPAPAFQAVLVSSMEFLGGIAILLGLFTRFFSVGLLITMIVAILTAQLENVHGIGDLAGLTESAYAAFFIWLAVAGAGPVSVDHVLAKLWANRAGAPSPATARALD